MLLACVPLMVACSGEDMSEEQNNPSTDTSLLPSTEIYVQGQLLAQEGMGTRANYQWPKHTEEGWETARFSIRADSTIPDYTDKSSALYYGRFQGGNNKGKVYTYYPYGHYNDRDLDYYQKDKKTGNNIGLFRYVYDPTGMTTQLPLMEIPLVEDILRDEVETLTNDINKGSNVAKNTAELAKVNKLLEDYDSEYLNSHVLWYVVKEVGMQYGWHVNGVLTKDVVPNYVIQPDKVPNNVEVDIHQQEHQDWNEIKTSVHIRADVESVTINLPIREENIVEQDDFDIRVYDYYYKEYTIKHKITHNAQGITIEIYDIPATLIETLKTQFGDGLTVEVHSYCKQAEGIWEDLKKSCVVRTGKACTVNGQITSAFNTENVPITIMHP